MTLPLTEAVVCRLQRLLSSESLTGGQKHLATALAARLDRPTRVAVAGFKDSGIGALLDVILGERLASEFSAPAVDIVYGDRRRATTHDQQGAVRHVDLESESPAIAHAMARCTLELTLPELKAMQLVKLTLPDDDEGAGCLLDALGGAADISIWCTKSLDEREALLWSRLPARLKDHSFLVVSQPKQPGTTNLAKAAAAAGFTNIFPVAVQQAVLARAQGRILDQGQWNSSGAAAFLSALFSEIETNRTADLDYAEILLSQHERPKDRKTIRRTPAERSESHINPLVSDAQPSGRPEERKDAMDAALSILNRLFGEVSSRNSASEPAAEEILQKARQAAKALSDLFADTTLQMPEIDDLRSMTQDCDEILARLQTDHSEVSARDAVTALLQVKKEISEVAAA
jgi:hypothetical protein